MRRVVVTGLGIVSSIGTGQDEVAASLREAKSGVQRAASFSRLREAASKSSAEVIASRIASVRRVKCRSAAATAASVSCSTVPPGSAKQTCRAARLFF